MPSRARRLIGPGIATLLMLAALIALGTWQVHRLAWKTALLAGIDRAEAAPGVPLPASPPEFLKVRISGTFHYDQTARYGVDVRSTPRGEVIGTQLVTPLFRTEGPPVLIDRGWAPTDNAPPIAQSAGEVTVEGYVRLPDYGGLFTPKDDPAQRVFYALDPAKIGAALGLAQVAPVTVVALGRVSPGVYPEPATALPRPPNDHLSYALTWYGLAVVLLVVFAVYARKVLSR